MSSAPASGVSGAAELRRRLPAALAGATLLFGLFTFADSFLGAVQGGLLATAQLALLSLICAGGGRVLLRLLRVTDISDSQKTLIGATLGLGALCLAVFALAAAQALRGWSVALAVAALWLVGFSELRPVLQSLGANRNLLRERPLASAAIAALLLLALVASWAPPHQYDSLVYHLPLPEAYIRAGGLVKVGHFVYGQFPQNAEMLFTLALMMGSDLLAQLLMWLATALSVWWVFELGKREAPLSAVLLSCLLLAGHTSVLLLASTTYVEPLVMLWVTAGAFSFYRWRQLSAANPEHRGWLVLSALFIGLALGTKYYAGIAAAIIGLMLLDRALRAESLRQGFFDLALFTGIVTALFAPWLIKNWIYVGNPVFPFFNYLFPGAETSWNEQFAKGYFSAVTEYRHGGRFFGDVAASAFMLLRNDPRFGGGMDVLGRLGWELIFWSLPLAAWAAWRNGFLRGLLVFCGFYLAAWFATGVVLRFLAALAPLLCLLAGSGLYQLWSSLGRGGRAALGAGVGFALAAHLMLFFFVHGVFGTGRVLLGLESREEFLSRRLDYYPCARAASRELREDQRVLIVGDQRGYYLDRPHDATTVHAPNPFIGWANESESPEALRSRLREAGYSALLVVPREARRLGVSMGALTEDGQRRWSGLESRLLRPLFQGPACLLYGLEGGA